MSEEESNGSVLEELRRLERAVADFRAQAGVEASELRARVRELERQVELLTASPAAAAAGHAPKTPKAERAAARAAKAERAAKKQAKVARSAESRPQEDEEEKELD